MKNLKKRLQQGETVNGCWLILGSPITAEIVGLAGFDWVLIDLEHGAGTEREALAQMQAIQGTAAASIVRVESGEPARIARIMDMGAEGIMCPKVNNADDALKIVNGLHYPPKGNRGVAKLVRAADYGYNFASYYSESFDNVLGIVQIETVEALDNVDAIAAVEGVDVLFIGPSDLTMSMGIFGQFEHPEYLTAVKKIIQAAQKAGKSTGILFYKPEEYIKYHTMGIRFIACSSDGAFVIDAAKNMADKLKDYRSQLVK
jgi:4-hydroxy-2-oxoheptanedioate aldolase